MIYCDTSLVVSALVLEPETGRVKAWLREQPPGMLAISDWVDTEVASALSIKQRRGELDPATRAEAERVWYDMAAGLFSTLRVERAHFRQAARFAAEPRPALRGGDALHLAVAKANAAAMATLDGDLAEVCAVHGVPLAF